jgi:hypothetical protein
MLVHADLLEVGYNKKARGGIDALANRSNYTVPGRLHSGEHFRLGAGAFPRRFACSNLRIAVSGEAQSIVAFLQLSLRNPSRSSLRAVDGTANGFPAGQY